MNFISQIIKKKLFNKFYKKKNEINKFDNVKNTIKYYTLMSKLNIKKNINIVECGVGAGESLSYLSLVTQIMKINKKIWAFDSFEGFPEFTEEDVGKYQKGRNKTIYKNYNIDYVKNSLKSCGVNDEEIENINFIKGFFPDSFKHYNGERIDFLHLDVDLYKSYKYCLEFFWPFLDKGSIVLFDEYKSESDLYKWPGASRAIDEFFKKKKIEINRIQIEKFSNKSFLII